MASSKSDQHTPEPLAPGVSSDRGALVLLSDIPDPAALAAPEGSSSLLEGKFTESLRSMLSRRGKIPLRAAIDTAFQLCAGLKEAHAQGVVHGGLKPENIFIDSHGGVKITDFGIGGLTASGSHIAPEQAAGGPANVLTDIFALGSLLHELFTGTSCPQDGGQSSSDQKFAMPVSIERAVQKCLEPEPANRFQSLSELETALNSTGTRSILASSNDRGPTLANREVFGNPSPQKTFSPVIADRRVTSYRLAGVILGALVIITVVTGVHWVGIASRAKAIPLPARPSSPVPPKFALEYTGAEASRADARAASGASDSQESTAKPPGQRADLSDAPGQTYLWVDRFEQEELARDAAMKIEELGLPAVVVPKHNQSDEFFVVLSGPFSGEKLEESRQELEEHGFANIHPIANLKIGEKLDP